MLAILSTWLGVEANAALDGGGAGAGGDAVAAFHALRDDFLDAHLAASPVSATHLGDHRYDGRWPAIDPASREARADELRTVRDALARIPLDGLGADDRVDAAILAHHLDAALFSHEQLRPWETNPLSAVGTVGSGLDYLVERDYAPLPVRMEALRQRLEGLPALLATYLVGLLEVMDLRRDAEARDGAAFDERAFNDALIAHGSIAPRHLRGVLGLGD